MLTATQAAKFLSLGTRTMYDLAKSGKVACHRMGVGDGALRFDPADLEEYKRQCRSPATTRAAGSTSLTASSPEPAGSALTDYFRKAGREPKPKRTSSAKQRGSTNLQLVGRNRNG
jgi:excisionase family DNA binding protein